MTVLLFPLERGDPVEGGVKPRRVVPVDPPEDRPPRVRAGREDAALEALTKERFGLVVLDINMPKTDGYGVLSQMRLRPESRSTPVLMLSSRVQEHDIVRAFDLGADDYVTKPFNPLELVSRIRRLMRRH